MISPSTIVPQFGPYNTLMCRPGQIASFPLNAPISQSGLVIAMDFYPYSSSGSVIQVIFSIRNMVTNFISLNCVYHRDTSAINIGIDPINTPNYLMNGGTMALVPVKRGK